MRADLAEMSVGVEMDGVDGAGKTGDDDDVVRHAHHRVETRSRRDWELVGEVAAGIKVLEGGVSDADGIPIFSKVFFKTSTQAFLFSRRALPPLVPVKDVADAVSVARHEFTPIANGGCAEQFRVKYLGFQLDLQIV